MEAVEHIVSSVGAFLRKRSPYAILLMGFGCLILFGALLLLLPAARQPGMELSFLDALFTATSATCVTGLVTVDVAATFNLFGRTVILCLIQLGGLGVATVGVFTVMLLGRRIGLKERVLLKESLNQSSIRGIVSLMRWIVIFTASVEGAGALLSFMIFRETYEPLQALGLGIFHSISSFNNAGFDLFGDYQSLIPYKHDGYLLMLTSALIIIGGLGYVVIRDLFIVKNRELSLHSKIVLSTTAALLLGGTLVFKLNSELNWLGAFFQSVTCRTAGFAAADMAGLSQGALLFSMILMLVGASPGSTGGGMKTTTVFTVLVCAFRTLRREPLHAFKREITMEQRDRASVIFVLMLTATLIATLLILFFEPALSMTEALFEVISALCTVGLTMGCTPALSSASKLVLILTMFMGRVGLLTMAYAWSPKERGGSLRRPAEKYIIG